MTNKPIERLRYFDGERLRSSDFQAEQAYHLEMRRRLNLQLHLFGIVTGLQLTADADSLPPDAPLFAIAAGMAIDQLGREIVLDAPYTLFNDQVLRRKGIQTGWNELWLCYKESQSGLPAAGYELCNDPNQKTRYREQFEVLFVPIPKSLIPPGTEFEDPDALRKGVRLGSAQIEDAGGVLRIIDVKSDNRTYIGTNTQRVVAPSTEADPFDAVKDNVPNDGTVPGAYVDFKPPVMHSGNVLATKNLVVGGDFVVDAPAIIIEPNEAAPDFTGDGNLKVTKNLILNGGIVASVNNKWYSLRAFIKTLMPEFVVGAAVITPTVGLNPSTGTEPPIVKKSNLAFVSDAQFLVSLNAITWRNKTDQTTWWSTITASNPIEISVDGVPQRQGGSPDTWEFRLTWTVGPRDNPAVPANAMINVESLRVHYLIIFYP